MSLLRSQQGGFLRISPKGIMYLRKLLLAWLLVSIAPMVSAMSLGEGQILSHVGEPLSVNIALLGSYNRDVSFTQVRNAECRSSVIATSSNGCDSLYEGALTFSIRQRTDGQYFLRVVGVRSDELFYRILIKASSVGGGTVFKTFEFLPEFSANQDAQSQALKEVDTSIAPRSGKYGMVGGKIIEVPDDEIASPAKRPAAQPVHVKAKAVDQPRQQNKPVDAMEKKPVGNRLQIKKSGEFADDIHALQKENGEIEEQIVLLERHIGLLKEVIRLKDQAGGSSVAPAPVVAAPRAAPLAVPVQPQPAENNLPGMLIWILLALVLLMAMMLGWLFLKMRKLNLNESAVVSSPAVFSPASLNEMKPLDLTGSFEKPKW